MDPPDAVPLARAVYCADPEPGPPVADIGVALALVPGLGDVLPGAGRSPDLFFTLTIRQLIDHSTPGGPTFKQRITIVHHSTTAPTILGTQGYDLSQAFFREEPAQLLTANQVEVEHRYFTPSIPDSIDWTKLTIWQAAADDHCIVRALDHIYPGPWIGTGQSKGGMAAVFHRRFFPDDTVGTVAYVAPLSRGAPDPRYIASVETGTHPDCRQKLRDFQVLADGMRPDLETRMSTIHGVAFETLGVDVAFEHLVLELPFGFWQYLDASNCDAIPVAGASADDVFDYLDQVGQVSLYDDALVSHYGPYYVQAANQLGYPQIDEAPLAGMLNHPGTDNPIPYLPAGAPSSYDPKAMADIADWVSSEGTRMLFIYGENDPWSAGMFDVGSAVDSFRLIVPEGNHNSLIADLPAGDQSTALDALHRWTKVAAKAPLAPAAVERYIAPRHAAYP